MWSFRKARQAKRLAAQQAMAAEIERQLSDALSLDLVDPDGLLNCRPIALALGNRAIVNLNLKHWGYELARQAAAALPIGRETAARHVGLACKPSTQADMESDWVAHWCGALKTPVIMHRKLWELSYVLQALHEHGHLRPGARGIGFGCGEEPIASFLAAQGMAVTVTDLPADRAQAAGWADTGQHAASLEKAFQPHLVDRARFDALVRLENVDMNAIPPHLRDYDCCWSICAMEHLGSIAKGQAFVENALATLRPGGLAVHTTEFNIVAEGPTIDDWPSVLFQRRHLIALADRLRAAGHDVAAFDFDFGDKPMDRFIDLPPWAHATPPEIRSLYPPEVHLKVATDGFVATCFGLIVRKA